MVRTGATWPLEPDKLRLLEELAGLIARGGAWRFVKGPVAVPDATDYPDPWDESSEGVGRIVARTLWHAHLSVDAVLEDVRDPAAIDRKRLQRTLIELSSTGPTSASFELFSIGNDDVAGTVSHEVGRYFASHAARAGHPFRRVEEDLPTAEVGAIATVVLGLGVVAANAARYYRSAGAFTGTLAYLEHDVVEVGGLDALDLAFLLAVQAVVRGGVPTAFGSLHPTQAAEVASWREVLEGHGDELRGMLALADADTETPVDRPEAPRSVTVRGAFDEGSAPRVNRGRRTFRVAKTQTVGCVVLGMIGGGLGGLFVSVLNKAMTPMTAGAIVALVAGSYLGWRRSYLGKKRRDFECASCEADVQETDSECPGCGGWIVEEIANANDRLAREEELEEADRSKGS